MVAIQRRGLTALLGPRQHGGSVDGVLQLPHVARPVVAGEQLQRPGLDAQPLQPQADPAAFAKITSQQGDVVRPLPQGGGVDREDAQAVVEIASKLPLDHRLFQIPVGGGQDTHVHLEGGVVTDALQIPVLQHPQQLGLQRQGELADLVQEQGALVGQLELARPVVNGAGEGPLHVAEQLALRHRFRQGGAVEIDQWRAGTG